LRYWEREFRSIRPTKSAKGQRVYSRRDVENLLRVRDLLYQEGFTIAGAKKRLTGAEPARSHPASGALAAPGPQPAKAAVHPPPSPRIREKLTALRHEIEAFLEELG
jgi:DNA-binding transcriptional MerR regulator